MQRQREAPSARRILPKAVERMHRAFRLFQEKNSKRSLNLQPAAEPPQKMNQGYFEEESR